VDLPHAFLRFLHTFCVSFCRGRRCVDRGMVYRFPGDITSCYADVAVTVGSRTTDACRSAWRISHIRIPPRFATPVPKLPGRTGVMVSLPTPPYPSTHHRCRSSTFHAPVPVDYPAFILISDLSPPIACVAISRSLRFCAILAFHRGMRLTCLPRY